MVRVLSRRSLARRLAVAACAAPLLVAVTSPAFAQSTPATGKISVQRVAGANAIGTAIAASQYDWLSLAGPSASSATQYARVAVLARSDAYYDALAGSTLAIDATGPLLLTPPNELDPGVAAELRRVLPAGSTVYVLGGPLALSPAVAATVQAEGYSVVRLAGQDMYGTAIAIAKRVISLNENYANGIFLATGLQYYDALAAGTAAGQLNGGFVLLTDGDKMPAETAAFIKQLDAEAARQKVGAPVQYGIGGPATAALNAWDPSQNDDGPSFVGGNAEDTALLLADSYFFYQWHHVGIATAWGWYDALSGGAMAGGADPSANFHGGPILLTPPTGLYPGVAKFLAAKKGQLTGVAVLGGVKALPQSIENQVTQALGSNAIEVPPLSAISPSDRL
jgi:hypothetical protein